MMNYAYVGEEFVIFYLLRQLDVVQNRFSYRDY